MDKQELIGRIKAIIEKYGTFSMFHFESDRIPYVQKIDGIGEEESKYKVAEYYCLEYVVVPLYHMRREISTENMPYEELSYEVLGLILEFANKWAEKGGMVGVVISGLTKSGSFMLSDLDEEPIPFGEDGMRLIGFSESHATALCENGDHQEIKYEILDERTLVKIDILSYLYLVKRRDEERMDKIRDWYNGGKKGPYPS